jgi:hypothetical protein
MLGIHNNHFSKEEAFETVAVEKHPNFATYGENFKESYSIFDVAIATVSQKIEFSDKIRPICLPQRDGGFDSKEGIVAGW